MSQRQYAKHVGLSRAAVQKAINSGRISTLSDGRIDSDTADREWRENTEARPAGASKRQHDDDDAFGASQYTKARAVREHYQARLAKLEYEEKVGSLISKDEVQIATFNKFRQYRDGMLNIPDRVAAMLAAETDAAKCYEILATEIRKALNEFADANG
ncbi:MAG TPA: hypothetical protein VFA33_05220 [Bryobacteraceae bacterium]|nr:hypothetical protein [Bryobacteraceae bacterium]